MKEPIRPVDVPADASWNAEEKEWQLGASSKRGKKTFPIGDWIYWAAEGYIICKAHFDNEGNVDGVVERFHPDGTLASRGEWKNGRHHGHFVHWRCATESPEPYSADSRTWRYEYDSKANWEENNPRWFLADGTECTSDGRPLSSAFDLDEVFEQAEPQNYLTSHARKVFQAFNGEPAELVDDPFDLANLWALSVPEIDRFASLAVADGEFSICRSRRKFEGNIWRSLIAHQWGNMYEELGSIFMGAVQIGGRGDSDSLYATLTLPLREEGWSNVVYYWSHDTYYIDEVMAVNLDDFAFAMALSAGAQTERLSRKAAFKNWRKLGGRIGFSANCLFEDEEDELDDDVDCEDDCERSEGSGNGGNLDPVNKIRGFFWRAYWIIMLLRPDAERNWDEVKECFYTRFNPSYNEELVQSRLEQGHKVAPTALYLLWRYFFCNQQERLSQCLLSYENHPAPIVRDLVSLIKDILVGRGEIAGVADLLAVRDQFLKLDLVPEDAERRKEQEKAAFTEAAEQASAVGALAREKAAESFDSLVELAWTHVADERAMREIEAVARSVPGHQQQWHAFDWVCDRRYEQANSNDRPDAVELGQWLALNGGGFLKPFLVDRLNNGDFEVAALLLPAMVRSEQTFDWRLWKPLLERLRVSEKYNHRRALAVTILGESRTAEAALLISNLLLEFLTLVQGKSSDDARLAGIPWDDLLAASAIALAKLKDPVTNDSAIVSERMHRLTRFAVETYSFNLAARLIDALIARGETKNLFPFIQTLLRSGNDDCHFRTALRAIELLAPRADKKSLEQLVEFGLPNPRDYDNAVTMLYHRALAALARVDGDELQAQQLIQDGYATAVDLECYGAESWKAWRIVQCETVGRFDYLPLCDIERYLWDDDLEVRRSAEKAYVDRSAVAPVREVLSLSRVWEAVDGREDDQACAEVAALLVSPQSVHRGPAAAWLWEHPSARGAEALAMVMDRELDRFVPPGGGDYISEELQWFIKSLARHASYESTHRTLARCLEFRHEDIGNMLLHDLEQIPSTLAPTLIKIARENEGWRRNSIAKWALAKASQEAVAAALKEENVTERKLKSWAK
ncbi:MAG: hypothetical protein K2W95_13385 [Candidatus Obscuribacterales bacterium]|nr:hypothetical protein [Candidatus Obscuribacterales bacterium]